VKTFFSLLQKKLFAENAPLVMLVGLCPLLIASKTLISGLVMAAAISSVLIFSCVVISLVRKLIPDNVRLVAYMIIIATLVSVAEIMIRAYLPTHYVNLGIYIPIIASAGIVFAQADNVASKNGIVVSVIDGTLTAITFSIVIITVSFLRELLGSGTILSHRMIEEEYGMSFALSGGGGLVILGMLAAVVKKINSIKKSKKEGE